MITKHNFKNVLQNLGFNEATSGVYQKCFGDLFQTQLVADFNHEKLFYPDALICNDVTTCNFTHPENFVVFECVVRLLSKGYRPEHIELEKRWNLGHDAKGGKADICVYDAEHKNMLMIIECKTYGQEYVKAKREVAVDGGQLFSYWQQERSTQWLALYASDVQNGKIVFANDIINCSDDQNLLELAKKDDTIKLYKNAHSVPELYEVWTETYSKHFYQELIFGEDTVAYRIGVRPLRKKDLTDFKPEDKIVNRFEEILRHNNVSDKENAFNRLTALFICKLVDEKEKGDDDELEFQYKQGVDTYETLQDRLQKLHRAGMNDFMKEKIFYVGNDYAENLVKQYSGQKRKAMIEELQNTIRILKFYTNNDFSFKDVHNEELFYQNGKVLVEVVQLFERYKIVYPNKHQFLGDLFEQLLNKGFKQNEGQFFTPMPITRFVWDSLPLNRVIHESDKYTRPKVIDFACGAGHFLTEAVEAINAYLKRQGIAEENAWVEKHIFGIEKDYRLARVSKISLFMNGAGGGNIIFGDGLDNYPEKEINAGTFDVLVANPPYSVSAFKAHLKPKNNQFELINRITNDGSEIEVLFVERIAQLLKPKGIAAVILPSSILSNSNNSYIGARENLLENFNLRAIAQFGSKTFGATGTNTIILFLEKYDEPPKRREMVNDSVSAILSQAELTDWEDKNIFQAYLAKIQVSETDYACMLSKKDGLNHWQEHAYFGQYVKAFMNLTDVKAKLKQVSFKKLSKEKQEAWLQEHFYQYIEACEKEKLYIFALVYQQKTLVVTSPTDNSEQKEFLGYDWSNRKGAEGIQILTPGGKLYNDADRTADNTISAAIRKAFDEQKHTPAELEKYLAWHRLQDMIDFSRVEFNKEIKTTVVQKIEVQSKWDLVKLGDVANVEYGDRIVKKNSDGQLYPVYGGGGETFRTSSYNRENRYVISRFGMSPECVRYVKGKFYLNDSGMTVTSSTEKLLSSFLDAYLLCQQASIYLLGRGSSQKNIDMAGFANFQIPLPPLEIQQKIVSECEAIDAECEKAREFVEKESRALVSLADSEYRKYDTVSLGSICGTPPMYGANVAAVTGDPSKDYRYIRITDITDDGQLNDDWNTAKEVDEKYVLREGDLLFARSGATAGKTFHYREIFGKAIFAGYLIKFRPIKEKLSSAYLEFILKSSVYEAWAKETRGGTAQPNINAQQFASFQIPLPSMEEQKRMIVEFEKMQKRMDEMKQIISTAPAKKQTVLDKYL